jgi:hypothetical protein
MEKSKVNSFRTIISTFIKKFTVKNLAKTFGFVLFCLISTFVSITMYLIIGKTSLASIIMVCWGAATELFKIYSAIMLTSSLFVYGYYRKKAKVHKIEKDGFFGKPPKQTKRYLQYRKKTKALRPSIAFYLVIYLICVFTSLYASLGYGLVTVHSYSSSSQLVDNSDKIARANEYIAERNTRILEKRVTLEQKKALSAQSLRDIKALDDQDPDYATKRAKIESKMNSYNNDAGKISDDINTYSDQISAKEDEILSLQTSAKDQNKDKDQSMFDLMSSTLKIPAETLLFFLVALLVIVCETGIITLAPHQNTIDEEENKSKAKKPVQEEEEDDDEEDDDDEEEDYDPQSQHNKKDLDKKLADEISPEALKMIDHSMENLKKGVASPPIDLRPINVQRPVSIEAPRPVAQKPVEIQKPVLPKPIEALRPIEKKPDEDVSFLKNTEVRKILNEEEKELLIINIEKVVDEIKNHGGQKFSIESLSVKTGISLEEIKKMFTYLSNLSLLSYDETTKVWKFRINRDEILSYLRNMPTIKY